MPRGQTLLSGHRLSSYKLKAFPALRPCASLNEVSLLCLEADGSLGMRVPKWEDQWQAGPLVTGMCSLSLATRSVLHPSTHTLFTSARNAYFHTAASAVGMGLTLEDVSEPRTVAMRYAHPLTPIQPFLAGPFPRPQVAQLLCGAPRNSAIIVGFGFSQAASGGPETHPSPQLKKKSEWPKDMTSAPKTTKQELA